MSLLEQLEAAAEAAHGRRAVAEAASEAQAAMNRARAEPVLERVRRYLTRSAAALNAMDEPVQASYQIPGVGAFGALTQVNYQCVAEPEAPLDFRLRFECQRAQPVKAVLASEALAREHERSLIESGMGCRRVAHNRERRALLVEGRVPVTLRFQEANGAILLTVRNLEDVGTHRFTLRPEQADDAFLEALLAMVMRRGGRVSELTGNVVSDDERARLRKQLARDQRRRKAELKGGLHRALFPVLEAWRRGVLGQ